jgi:MYXO-CTERM domain-containing protein
MIFAHLLIAPVVAGYADVDVDVPSENTGITRNTQYPSLSERELHMYTNMVRVAPEEFEDWYQAYDCSFDEFTSDEQTAKAPLFFSRPLNEAARFHSQDMEDNNWFEHDSSDGTGFGDRVARWYTETRAIGENISVGATIEQADFGGWMCSSGHRENIMRGSYTELGAGVSGRYYTQDFAGSITDSPYNIAMGVHVPPIPVAGENVVFYADYQGPGPERMELILTGQPQEMSLILGTEQQGVWAVELDFPDGIFHGDECEQYYFLYSDSAGEGRFPQTGSYRVGRACEDPNYGWSPWQFGVTGRDDRSEEELESELTITGSGCSTAPGPGSATGLAWLALVLGWRRRDSGQLPQS